MRSSSRVRKLVQSVCQWVDVPNSSDGVSRQAGWVTKPHRYGRKTRQVAIRTPDAKKKGGYRYSVLITTDMEASLHKTVTDYDGRSGVPESSFCQDNQGLSIRKRRKRSFVAQKMLMLLSQLAHNLIRWIQNWMIDAVQQITDQQITEKTTPPDDDTASPTSVVTTISSLKERGMKRFVRQIFSLSGKVIMVGKRVIGIILNPLYPLIKRMKTAFEALLTSFGIYVSLDEN